MAVHFEIQIKHESKPSCVHAHPWVFEAEAGVDLCSHCGAKVWRS